MTNTRLGKLIVVLVGIAAIILMVTYRVHFVASRDNFTELVASDDEAFLVVRSSRVGYRRSLVQLPADVIAASYGMSPTDVREDLVIVRLTGAGLERREFHDVTIGSVGVVDGRAYVYADRRLSPTDGRVGSRYLIRLTDMQPATADEQQRVTESGGLANTDGWVAHRALLTSRFGESTFNLTVGGQPWVVIARNNRSSDGWTAIDVQKGNEPPQRVWYVDTRSRFTSKNEYDAFLSQGTTG